MRKHPAFRKLKSVRWWSGFSVGLPLKITGARANAAPCDFCATSPATMTIQKLRKRHGETRWLQALCCDACAKLIERMY